MRASPPAALVSGMLAMAVLSPVSPRLSAQSTLPSISMIVPEGDAAHYWSRWRGPSGQGVASDSGYVDTWSDKQNILWRGNVPGRGNSSPIVWNDRIFLTTGYSDGRVSVLCYSRATGKMLWETFNPD